MDLVSTDRQQINIHFLRMDPELTVSLYRIHMEQDPAVHSFDQGSGFFYGLQGTDLIIGVHNGHQNSFPCNGTFQILQADTALFIYRKISYPVALFLKLPHGLQNRRMLDLCRDQVLSPAAVGVCTAPDRQII